MTKVKGIILAGGNGTRLKPMTDIISKQLLPIYNKPMIYYPLSVLKNAGIKEILIITKPEERDFFVKLLGDGSNFGIRLDYLTQDKPKGIAEAFIIAKDWLQNSNSLMILGDNLFFGLGLKKLLQRIIKKPKGATIFAYEVSDPHRYGVVSFDNNKRAKSIIEKPKVTKSSWAVTGLYYYDSNVTGYAELLKPSKRGELEITDLNKRYLKEKKLDVEILGSGFTWLDTGTPDSLLEAANFVKIIESRQGLLIGDPNSN